MRLPTAQRVVDEDACCHDSALSRLWTASLNFLTALCYKESFLNRTQHGEEHLKVRAGGQIDVKTKSVAVQLAQGGHDDGHRAVVCQIKLEQPQRDLPIVILVRLCWALEALRRLVEDRKDEEGWMILV